MDMIREGSVLMYFHYYCYYYYYYYTLGKVIATSGHQSTLKLHRPMLHDAINANANTLISIAGGLCSGNIINSKIKDDVILARNNDGATFLLECLEVIVNEKPITMSKVIEILEHEQVLSSIVKSMKEEEERKKKAAYEVAGLFDYNYCGLAMIII